MPHFRQAPIVELQPDVDEVVGRPGARVLERQLVVALADLLHAGVEVVLASRATRNAAFMIIRSPIGLFDREATETSRSASKISAT
jgi:hypothetical protein